VPKNARELEVKIHIADKSAFEQRIIQLGANLKKTRQFEHNLIFDTPTEEFQRTDRVLRLRRDDRIRITLKEPAQFGDGVKDRREVEFEVDDYDAARDFLEGLGYQARLIYEKYRTSYQLGEVEVVLDEMPYGDFIEIEGPSAEIIQSTTTGLNLDIKSHIRLNYIQIFKRLCELRNLPFRDLTFANFRDITISFEDIERVIDSNETP
jgi:adenylate cyclase class 2